MSAKDTDNLATVSGEVVCNHGPNEEQVCREEQDQIFGKKWVTLWGYKG